MTPEVRVWLHDLRKRDRASAIQVGQAIGMLLEAGPELGRPLARRPRPPLPAEQPEGTAARLRRAQRDPHPVYLRSPAEHGPAGSRSQGWERGGLVPPGDPAGRAALRGLPETRGHPMSSSEFRHYTRDEFHAEFYPDPADKAD